MKAKLIGIECHPLTLDPLSYFLRCHLYKHHIAVARHYCCIFLACKASTVVSLQSVMDGGAVHHAHFGEVYLGEVCDVLVMQRLLDLVDPVTTRPEAVALDDDPHGHSHA